MADDRAPRLDGGHGNPGKGRTVIGERPKHQVLIRIAGPQAATLLLVVAGALLAAGAVDGLYWQAAGVAACLVVGIADAWVLLVEILR